MTNAIRAEVRGLRETQRKMEKIVRDLHGGPFLDAMRKATLIVQRSAKLNAPVDTGILQASIVPAIKTTSGRIFGIVGTNVEYAPAMEEPGNVRVKGRRPYLEPALTENNEKIVRLLDRVVGRIVTQ
jgi:hypothetical protein